MILPRILALSIATGFAAGTSGLAEEEAKLPPFELKNRSSFGIKAGTRTPFWPIGWSPDKRPVAVAGQPVAAKAFLIQPSHFTVTSVMLSHPPLATINSRAFGEGEMLPVLVGGQSVRVVVKAIRDGGVWLDQSGHQIFVPMRRQELKAPSAPEAQQPAAPWAITIEEKPATAPAADSASLTPPGRAHLPSPR